MSGETENRPVPTILVVDDHHVTRDMVSSILRANGYRHVITAENGAHALKTLEDRDVTLVVCDWNMPQMSGLELLKEVRKSKKNKSIPFLMLTAEAYRENVSAAAKSGVTGYISKPFTAEVLTDKVRAALNASDG